MMEDDEELNARIRIGMMLEKFLLDMISRGGNQVRTTAAVDSFVFTESEESAWINTEPSFTKRIYTEIPTKRRLRVTRSVQRQSF